MIGFVLWNRYSLPEPGVRFDREKFRDVVHYIIELCKDDKDKLGRTKLHKTLYFAHMLSYLETGEALTGVDYIKQPFGPTARHLGWALRTLAESGAIGVSQRSFHGFPKHDFTLRNSLQSNRLSSNERALVRDVVEFVCGYSAKEISEISHAKPWEGVQYGKRIPYGAAFLLLPQRVPTEKDLAWANQQADEILRQGLEAA